MIGLANNQGTSSSSNGCGTTGNSENDSETIRTLDVVDQLHDLFRHMSIFDETPETNREPIPPNNFLQAVGKLNPMFEGKYILSFKDHRGIHKCKLHMLAFLTIC